MFPMIAVRKTDRNLPPRPNRLSLRLYSGPELGLESRASCLRAAPVQTADAAECGASAARAPWKAQGRRGTVDHRRQHPGPRLPGRTAEPDVAGRLHGRSEMPSPDCFPILPICDHTEPEGAGPSPFRRSWEAGRNLSAVPADGRQVMSLRRLRMQGHNRQPNQGTQRRQPPDDAKNDLNQRNYCIFRI